ncbi:MAG: hypothetical protein LBT53_02450 [Puniceicoccales bacterium]|jgi:polygalacturonase|nr:hypothetical protein [Puniceicoccales bacterium]
MPTEANAEALAKGKTECKNKFAAERANAKRANAGQAIAAECSNAHQGKLATVRNLLVAGVLVLCLFIGAMPQLHAKDVNIVDFGAVGDGVKVNTTSIQNAIDACAKSGGGTITIPAGTFLSGSLFLRDNTSLFLNKCAVLKGVADLKSYFLKGEVVNFNANAGGLQQKSFIWIDSVSNVSISGEGTIDGNGAAPAFQKGVNAGDRPFLIYVCKSKQIVIKDVRLINPAFWNLVLFENDGVRIDGLTIYGHAAWNNDGIDIDSKNVIINNCNIDCMDDGICFKSHGNKLCENVTVTNCIIASNCNPIKFGTASVTGFKNIAISNCVIRPASVSNHFHWDRWIEGVKDKISGISGIAIESVDGGIIEQITISNISMTGIQTPVFICLGSRKKPTGSIKNVIISNIVATSVSLLPSIIAAVPGYYVENVSIRDMLVTCPGGGTKKHADRVIPEKERAYPENRMYGNTLPAYGFYIRHARGITLENVQFNLKTKDARPAVMLDDAHDILLRGFKGKIAPKNNSTYRVVE